MSLSIDRGKVEAGCSGQVSAFFKRCWSEVRQIIDSDYFPEGARIVGARGDRFEFRRAVPFILLHLGCLGVTWVGWSPVAVGVAVGAVSPAHLRGDSVLSPIFLASHISHVAGVAVPFRDAWQYGHSARTVWWASVHRHHHRHSDQEEDVNSPGLMGFAWAHIGWMTSSRNFPTNYDLVRDLARYPELRFLNRFDLVLRRFSGWRCMDLARCWRRWLHPLARPVWQMIVWGFFISTMVLLHATLLVNSLAHTFGRRRFETTDDSRNSLLLALITLGEGWHNNHHRYRWLGAAGVLLVGDRHHLLRAQAALLYRLDLGLRGLPKIVYDEPRRAARPASAEL